MVCMDVLSKPTNLLQGSRPSGTTAHTPGHTSAEQRSARRSKSPIQANLQTEPNWMITSPAVLSLRAGTFQLEPAEAHR
eukprot:897469-Prymnesium_polylepis.1